MGSLIKIVESPSFKKEDFDKNKRHFGISGFIRAKNEGEYIYQVIESWLSLVDEIIVVFNDCSDQTEAEIERAILDFGTNKITAFKYLPTVYPQGSEEHIKLPQDCVNSLVYYYNFSLSKTNFQLAVKIDGDIILDTSLTNKIKSKASELLSKNGYYKIYGVNLVDNGGELFVPSSSKFCTINGDLCIFPVGLSSVFKWRPEFEYLELSHLNDLGGMFAYYHMKFVKKDMGFGNYQLGLNKESRYVEVTVNFITGLRFISIKKILYRYKIELRLPSEMNIKPSLNRDFKKEYLNGLISQGVVFNFSVKNIFVNICKEFFLFVKYKIKTSVIYQRIKKYRR